MAATTQELSERLHRIYAAIGAVIDKAATATFQGQIELGPDGTVKTALWDFGAGVPSAELQNKAWAAIHNTATFYNHCRDWAHKNGIAKDAVNAVTENCLALRIIRDLDNADKHPEARPNTSGLSPQLLNVKRVLRIGASQATKDKRTIVGGVVVTGGDASLTIVGDIVNGRNGQVVAQFPNVIEEGITAWEAFLLSNKALT